MWKTTESSICGENADIVLKHVQKKSINKQMGAMQHTQNRIFEYVTAKTTNEQTF